MKGMPQHFLPGHASWEYQQQLAERSRDLERWYEPRDCGYESACWVWTRTLLKSGYGQITWHLDDGTRRTVRAHRAVYERDRGSVPEGMQLHHLCENRACVNPRHLQVVTPEEHGRIHHGGQRKRTWPLSGRPRRRVRYAEGDPPYEARDCGYETPCWIWIRCLHPSGYGKVRRRGRTMYAHRWLYERMQGALRKGIELDHLCENKACVNPAHLEPVTHDEHVRRTNARKARCRGAA